MHKSHIPSKSSFDQHRQKNSGFDLFNLIQISGNDMTFVEETIELVLLTTPETIENIIFLHKEKDLIAMKRIMHCVKPTMIMFNHFEVIELIREIEQSKKYSEISGKIIYLQSLFDQFMIELGKGIG